MWTRAIALLALVGWSGCGPLQGGINHGVGGNGGGAGVGGGGGSDDVDMSIDDTGDGGSAYNADFAVNSMCVPPQMATQCPNPIGPSAGCKATEDCGPSGSGNGLDDNCNGMVDEGCSCTPGAVEKCFLGPPGRRGVGACTDGNATCQGSEFGTWGPCMGSIGPSAETCDKLDNDCNGCADDGLCCAPAIDCPAPGDPRIAPQPPYTDVPLKGELFFPGAATSWSWKIVGGPCDQLFLTTTGTPPAQSFTLTGPATKDAVAHFTLSGDYTVTLTVVGADGMTYSCTWVQHIIGPGVRFELCWDHTGTDDLDLHVHKPGSTTNWFEAQGASTDNPDDCYYRNCKAEEYAAGNTEPQPAWGYANTALAECIGSPSGTEWQMNLNACHNPRLDIDNISDKGKPENINIDNAKNGDSFRAAVHYYTGSTEEHPMVNIYCGGNLKATFGKAPNTLTGFNNGQGYDAGPSVARRRRQGDRRRQRQHHRLHRDRAASDGAVERLLRHQQRHDLLAMIAWLGTGLLGGNFVRALRRRGEAVQVWNRSGDKARALEADGAVACAEPADAARGAARIHLTLSDDAAVDDVLERARPGFGAGVVLVDHTTTSATGTAARARRWAERGVAFQHAPVFMGPKNALDATGLMLASGERARFDALAPVLQELTGKLVYVGAQPERAAGMKLLGNLFLMCFTVGLADVLSLAKALDIPAADAASLFDLFNPGQSIGARLQRMTSGDYSQPSWELAMARKDARLMLDEAARADVPLAILPAIAREMDRFVARGHAHDDWVVVAKDALERAPK